MYMYLLILVVVSGIFCFKHVWMLLVSHQKSCGPKILVENIINEHHTQVVTQSHQTISFIEQMLGFIHDLCGEEILPLFNMQFILV